MQRRRFFQNLIGIISIAIAILSRYRIANAADIPEMEFTRRFQQVFADQLITDSDAIQFNLPTHAENGAVVPITISSHFEDIDRLYLWADKNPTPLVAEFELSKDVTVQITARIKLAESSQVILIAQQGEHLLRKQQWVNVMQGGCGTG